MIIPLSNIAEYTSRNYVAERVKNILKFMTCNSVLCGNSLMQNSPDYVIEKFELFLGVEIDSIKNHVSAERKKTGIENLIVDYNKRWGELNINIIYLIYYFEIIYANTCPDFSAVRKSKIYTPNSFLRIFDELIGDHNLIPDYDMKGIHTNVSLNIIEPYIKFNQTFFNRLYNLSELTK